MCTVSTIDESSTTTVEPKVGVVATWSRYVSVLAVAFHTNLSVTGWFTEMFGGEIMLGANGARLERTLLNTPEEVVPRNM
jgi:hypothetical protein